MHNYVNGLQFYSLYVYFLRGSYCWLKSRDDIFFNINCYSYFKRQRYPNTRCNRIRRLFKTYLLITCETRNGRLKFMRLIYPYAL